ncbi:dienelactone hydrolase family protein [Pedobacter sp. MR2016-24]|uniref:dienelactone hydrolase family protein n=1 Tax=Pedobacter sp. MR2016-24 TaxID=2994466 RepID=UPI002247FEBC|nr:dienelactone hydrolase family protein [Pedobacter sp. MR2016-24]MCX2482151.1 dienelactone hydrolase family protein [Pedobacter sp. MR2016-24]
MKKLLTIALTVLVSATYAQLKPVAYKDGAQKLNGFAAAPAKGNTNKAGILILPAWKGIDKHSKNVADDLAKLGYHAFIADIYGEGNYPADTKTAGERAGYYKKNITAYHKRIELAMQELIKSGAETSKIIVIGYCFGGTGAIEAARMNFPVKAVVSFHGGLGRDSARVINPIQPKVLVLHGADDPFEPAAEIMAFQQEMRNAKADWQMVYYANAVHSFTEPEAGNDNSKGAAYNELAAKRSWKHMLMFLDEVLAN